jgi:SAM-dependent methyltransferase
MIKEYWDDVDPELRPLEKDESEATVMVERPALKTIFPEEMEKVNTLAVGCYDHEPALEAARRGARVFVVDPSEEALDLMFQSLAREGLNAELVVSDPLDMSAVADGTVSLVTLGPVVNHLPDIEALFVECHRTLAPKGALMVIVPHPLVSGGHAITADTGKSQWLIEDYFAPAKVPYPRSIDEFVNTLLYAGFSLERVIEPKPDPMTKGVNNAIWNLYNRIPQLLFIVARKPA